MSHRFFIGVLALVLGAVGQIGCAKEETDDLFKKNSQGAGASKGKSDTPAAASCANSCEGSSEDGSCWCDPGCDLIGDCCADYATSCAGTQPASGGGGGASGGSGGASTGGAGGGAGGTKPATGGTGGIGGGAGVGGAGYGGTTSNPSSCTGHCGAQSPAGCYCDSACQASGDCCPDVASACGASGVGGGPGTGGGCVPQLCNTEQPASQNGVECYCDPMCMAYGDCCANEPQVCGF